MAQDTETKLRELDEIRDTLFPLVMERDYLRYRVCEDLEDQYQEKLGQLEYEALEVRYRTMRTEREIELIQKGFDSGEGVFLPAIQSSLDEEFKESMEQLRYRERSMEYADQHRQLIQAFGPDDEELRKEYERVARKIHPMLQPDGKCKNPSQVRRMVVAYRTGNIFELHLLALELENEPDLPYPLEMADLVTVRYQLQRRIPEVKEAIREIENSYPYNLKPLFADEVALRHMQLRFHNETASWQSAFEEYESERDALLMGSPKA